MAVMAEIAPLNYAPLNYERWAVMVSPLHGIEAPGVVPGFGARQAEELTQVSAATSRLDSRKKESLIEQTIRPGKVRRKILKRKSAPPPLTSHPAGWALSQPLPDGIYASARNPLTVDPRKVTELYKHPEPARVPSVRISG